MIRPNQNLSALDVPADVREFLAQLLAMTEEVEQLATAEEEEPDASEILLSFETFGSARRFA